MSVKSNIYGESKYETENVAVTVESDSIVFIDGDSNDTVTHHIKAIRDTLSKVPTDTSLTVLITCGNVVPVNEYWKVLFEYIGQLSIESENDIEVLFRGNMYLEMLSVFKYDKVSVSVSESSQMCVSPSPMLRYIGEYPERATVLVKQFPSLFNSAGVNTVCSASSIEALTSLRYSFEKF